MNGIKIESVINSLDIDYQRGKSLIIAVSSATQTKQQQFLIWSIVLIIGLIGLVLAFPFMTLLDFDTKGILWFIGFVLWFSLSIFKMIRNYSKMPYTFKKISFWSDKIEVEGKGTPQIIRVASTSRYILQLNQASERPQITMLIGEETIHFQLDNMQDFPIVIDAIADVLKAKFKEHRVTNKDIEELIFESG